MKILHVIDHLGLGGAQTVLGEFLRCWPEAGDSIRVVGLGRRSEMVAPFCSIANVDVCIYGGSKWSPGVVRRLRSEIRWGNYDVVHAHLTKATCATLLAVRDSTSRCLVHLHNDPKETHFWLRWAIRRWSNRIDLLIPCSQHTADSAGECFPRLCDRAQVIYNGIDFEQLDTTRSHESRREALGFAADDILLGFVGRLAEQKGVSYLLKSFALVAPQRPNVRLVIMGRGPLRAALEHECADLGLNKRVKFLGFRQDVRSWMQQLDVGVLPSLHEGLSLTLVEMMGYGIPVIATRVSGTPEIVCHGQTGLLVEARDVKQLADAIVKFSDDNELRRKLGKSARDDVRTRFCARASAIALRQLGHALSAGLDHRYSSVQGSNR